MQVSVETTSDSSRKITVQVPEEMIQEEVATRMKQLAGTARVAGFRPGKVPPHVLKRKFGGQVRAEALAEIMRSSFSDAVRSERLTVVGQPTISAQEASEGNGLTYEARFDVYPDISLEAIDQLEIQRPICTVSDADIDTVIERLREQNKTWHEVERPVREQDRVTVNLEGRIGDKPLTDGVVENFAVIVGSNQMMPGFEQHLSAAEKGAHLSFDIELAADYGDPNLAGKGVHFDVDVLKIEEARLPELDTAFFESFGIEDGQLETFRKEVKSSTEHQLQNALRQRAKAEVMNALYEKVAVAVPDAMIELEIDQMIDSTRARAQNQNLPMPEEIPRDPYRDRARRRVALALIMNAIAKEANLKASEEEIRSTLEFLVRDHENPAQVIEYYMAEPERRASIEQLVLEDHAVDWVLERARVTEQTVGFDEVMNFAAIQQPSAD